MRALYTCTLSGENAKQQTPRVLSGVGLTGSLPGSRPVEKTDGRSKERVGGKLDQ